MSIRVVAVGVMAFCFAGVPSRAVAQAVAQAAPPPQATVRALFTLGSGQPESGALHAVSTVAVDAAGSIWVADAVAGPGRVSTSEIKVFDSTGKWIRNIPGFVRVGRIKFENGLIVVEDVTQHKASLIRADGKIMASHTLAMDSDFVRVTALKGATKLVVRRPLSVIADPKHPPFTVVTLVTGKRTDTIAVLREDQAYAELGGPTGRWALAGFGRAGDVAWFGDSVVAAVDGYEGRITWYRAGADGFHEAAKDQFEMTKRAVTAADVKAAAMYLSNNIVSVGSGGGASRGVPEVPFSQAPSFWSSADRAVFSADGTLWVRRLADDRPIGDARDRDEAWLVFPASGARYGVTLPPGARLGAVLGNHVFALTGRGVRVYEVVVP